MKNLAAFFTLVGFLCAPTPLMAEEGHHHGAVGGPNGGRILENTSPQAEFLVKEDNTMVVSFYDHDLKPVPAAEQSVVVVAEKDGVKTNMEFEKQGDALVSKGALSEGEGHNLVIQLKETAEAKPTNFRLSLNKGICEMCKRAEYACICGH